MCAGKDACTTTISKLYCRAGVPPANVVFSDIQIANGIRFRENVIL